MGLFCVHSWAQTGGDGAIAGTVVDSSGAVVAGASVTATNVGTNVTTNRTTSGAGYYNIAPLIPGNYTVTVTAKGFAAFKQENMVIDAMHVSGLNITLKPGAESETITVTAAPPAMETTNAVLGATMENDTYMELPLMVSGNQQRDITQFSNLLPGAQVNPGGRSSVIGGTAQRLGELYLDGLPLTTISQQGDNRPVFNVVPMEAIDQIQVVTSSFSAEYQGAGLENYTLKSGTNKYHGTVADYIRNTVFDTWGFSAPWATVTNSAGVKGYQSVVGTKPPDHQNELAVSVGGPISIPRLFSGRDRLFFNASYDRVHSRTAPNYTAATIPTTLMQQGNFQELLSVANGGLGTAGVNYPIYDPTSLAACTKNSTTGTCRYQYGYGPGTGTGPAGNPVKTGAPINVIPASQISPITQYMQQYLPAPINSNVTNNYLGGIAGGYDNWLYSGHIDWDISPKQRLSMSVTGGNRANATYAVGSTAILPLPYLQGTIAVVAGHIADLSHTYTIKPNLVNQFKYGFANFGGPPVRNATQGITKYEAQTAGITGLPAGQAATEFPTNTFAGSNAQSQWSNGASSATYTSVSETFTMIDNVQWVKGKHAITIGGQLQWLQNQASTADGPSTPITLAWSPNDTAAVSGTSYTASTGYAYASYMLGAVDSTSDTIQTVSLLGGRYRPLAPYFQDDYKITRNLTLNLGLRWDYIPTYHEAQDRWSFLSPTTTNPATGNLGALMFAGNHGGSGLSIGSATPVQTYWKNWGPRLGFAYALKDKTVIRGGFGILYSHAGGTGGAGGAATGTGQNGFNTPISFPANGAGPGAGPAFYLNNNPAFSAQNTIFGGPGYTLPTATGPTAAAQTLNVGNYVTSSGAFVAAAAAPGYPDPYLAGRAPEFEFYNFGIQRELTKDITLSVNYSGSESHFIAGASNIRGLQAGQINPAYMPVLGAGTYLGSSGLGLLSKPATAANVALAQAAYPGLPTPYAGFEAAAASGSTGAGQATIAQSLKWMPQFSSTSDTWGNVANANYNSMQVSLVQRASRGLSYTVNYTYSKQLDDAGTQRSGWAIPASLTLNGQAWKQNRIDRSLSTLTQAHSLAVFGVYKLPFGKGGMGGDNFLSRAILSGWETSHIFTLVSGIPLTLSSSACTTTSEVGQGTCMPDINPNYTGGKKGIRQSGKWGQGVNALTLGTISYVQGYISSTTPGQGVGGVACASSTGPFCNSNPLMIGNAPRTGAFGLRAPSMYRLTSGLKRTFDITERFKFIFAVDCQNVTNAVTFGLNAGNLQIGTAVNSSSFGAVNFATSDSRDFQFSGRISF